MSDDSSTLMTYLESNPRMIGALFTLVLLLTQAGAAAAGNGVTISGP